MATFEVIYVSTEGSQAEQIFEELRMLLEKQPGVHALRLQRGSPWIQVQPQDTYLLTSVTETGRALSEQVETDVVVLQIQTVSDYLSYERFSRGASLRRLEYCPGDGDNGILADEGDHERWEADAALDILSPDAGIIARCLKLPGFPDESGDTKDFNKEVVVGGKRRSLFAKAQKFLEVFRPRRNDDTRSEDDSAPQDEPEQKDDPLALEVSLPQWTDGPTRLWESIEPVLERFQLLNSLCHVTGARRRIPTHAVPRALEVQDLPYFNVDSGRVKFSHGLGSARESNLRLRFAEGHRPDFTTLDELVAAFAEQLPIFCARLHDEDWEQWQNEKFLGHFKLFGRSTDGLKLVWDPVFEENAVDISQNPGRRVARNRYTEKLGTPHVADAFFLATNWSRRGTGGEQVPHAHC